VIDTRCESYGLYHLHPSSHLGIVMESPPILLHVQLGHPTLAKLKQFVTGFSKLSKLVYESCELGNHSRSSFSYSVTHSASSPFALVHFDIWGPSRVESSLGFQYFVTFNDDYSRCTWLFLMKSCCELFHIFQSFFNEIQTQFGVTIKILQNDNGHEYLFNSFKQFMAFHGILHQTSYAYTPQQNVVAKRKNRHLIGIAHTLLIHGEVPQSFWGDVGLIVYYLINCMPYSVLNNKILHSILFPHEPLHPLPLKVFGSTCFVHNFSLGLDKLSPRSHKCVFLGFTRSQIGYKYFSPTLNRYFVCADVIFNESSFYYKSSSHSIEFPPNIVDFSSPVNIPMICDLPSVPCTPSVSTPPPLLSL